MIKIAKERGPAPVFDSSSDSEDSIVIVKLPAPPSATVYSPYVPYKSTVKSAVTLSSIPYVYQPSKVGVPQRSRQISSPVTFNMNAPSLSAQAVYVAPSLDAAPYVKQNWYPVGQAPVYLSTQNGQPQGAPQVLSRYLPAQRRFGGFRG